MRSPLLVTLFLTTISTIAITNAVALRLSLYWKYTWLDLPMHAIGGAAVALGFFLLPVFRIRVPRRYFALLPVLSCVLIVGLLWEIFEIGAGMSLLEDNFVYDMFLDLVMDLVGGSVGYFVGSRIRNF